MTYKDKKHAKSSWISREKLTSQKKPWGYEKSWNGFDGIHGKLLFIKFGERTSLKYNVLKSEVLMLKSGRILVQYGDEMSLKDPIGHPIKEDILNPGDSLLVQSGCPYRIKALEDSEIFEIGNKLSDKPIRLEDDYGRVENEENA